MDCQMRRKEKIWPRKFTFHLEKKISIVLRRQRIRKIKSNRELVNLLWHVWLEHVLPNVTKAALTTTTTAANLPLSFHTKILINIE
jgi:hypothetical protein